MPGMTGIETATAIFEFCKEFGLDRPTIVGLSGHVGDEYQRNAVACGMKSLEAKPITLRKLREIFASAGINIKSD